MSKERKRCPVCGTLFTPNRNQYTYCSKKCSGVGTKERYKNNESYREEIKGKYYKSLKEAMEIFPNATKTEAFKSYTLLKCVKKGKLCRNRSWGIK